MVKFSYIVSALLTAALLGGCRTPEPQHAPASGTTSRVDLSGTLKLIDGTPVPGADITARCGEGSKSARTDAEGRFAVAAVPEGACTIASARAGVEKHLRISKRLLGDRPTLRLEVPAKTRLVLSGFGRRWVVEVPASNKSVSLMVVPGKRTTPQSRLEIRGETVLLTKLGCSTCKPRPFKLRPGIKLPVSQTNDKLDYVLFEEVERLAVMPLALRRPARNGTIFKTHLTTLDLRAAKLPVADRNLILLSGCNLKSELIEELDHLAGTYRATGLKVTVLQTKRCLPHIARYPLVNLWLSTEENKTSGASPNHQTYFAPEAAWALAAKLGDVVVIDRDGKVVFRQHAGKQSGNGTTAFDDAISFLDRTWPALAARRRISVASASSVKTAEAVRLTEQVDLQLKAAKYPEAHRLLDRLVQLSPELAEARKLRALIRARLGDYTGAMQEVNWWRTSFGSESAEELEDQVKQASKGRLGALRVTR